MSCLKRKKLSLDQINQSSTSLVMTKLYDSNVNMWCIHLLNTRNYCDNTCKYCGNTHKYGPNT